jgi:preprotein translocase subunit SecE
VNRETKRMMQRQGQMEADGSPASRRPPPASASKRAKRKRTSVPQFAREVRDEMRQVAWPSRKEMVNYTSVVLTTLVIMITLIFLLNYAFAHFVLWMFQK